MITSRISFVIRKISNIAVKTERHVNYERTNTLLSQYILKVKSRKVREQSNLIALEGKRLIGDALSAKVSLEAVFYSLSKSVEGLEFDTDKTKLHKVSYKQMKLWSDLVTPPGIIAFANIGNLKVNPCDSALPVTLICDEIRDPGNLGSILRSAAAASVSRVLLSKGCVDPWDCKVLRGGSGAHFRVPLLAGLAWDDIKGLVKPTDTVLVADSRSADSESASESSADYTDIDFRPDSDHTFLVVGGETGLSKEATSFDSSTVHRIHIPLENGVESLNSAVAFSIIVFHLRNRFKSCTSLSDS